MIDCLSIFDMSLSLNLKPLFIFMVFIWLDFFYLETIGSELYHDLMTSIWEKAISILAGNLKSGHSYLITAVSKADFYTSKALIFKLFGKCQIIRILKIIARLSGRFSWHVKFKKSGPLWKKIRVQHRQFDTP